MMKKLLALKGNRTVKIIALVSMVLLASILTGCSAEGDTSTDGVLSGLLGTESSRSQSVNILILLTVLSLLPSILIMLTGFTRIIIVLSLIRNAIGLQQMPPNQVLVGLALFLTFFIMTPVISEINETAYQPYVQEQITQDEALTRAMVPIREFMMAQTYKTDLNFFLNVSGNEDAELEEYEDVPTSALIPAFITSEIKRGFQMGFFLYIPFIVIDMIVASTLMSMGMMMLPPVTISMPFKLLLFVLVDGWSLTIQTLLSSFG
ncbi:flagellar type III secretion system pore protein FliP [Eubacteriales bacterium OttesenSCG-928-M02]|nr:flagellar type III secretion system pore protein FliP [Eubacteriales bacterium OttesenSCG-928-M02]